MNPTISELLKQSDFQNYGFTALDTPVSIEYYKEWLNQNYHADMEYLKRHLPQKENPTQLLPKAKSAIVVAQSYFPAKSESFPLKKARVALYARQDDYHDWFQEKLNQLATQLKTAFPDHEFIAFTDSKPVLERDLAHKAGLGWVGKNSCLIHEKHGSLFFIGEIYTTLAVQVKLEVQPDRCGTCTRCIDICPTNALVEPKVLDANKCISYWTIESKKTPPVELRGSFENWYYGCDLCQTVCPWNQHIFKTEMAAELNYNLNENSKQILFDELRMILTSSDAELKKLFQKTPMMRAKPWAHKRNAILVAVNQGFKSMDAQIEALLSTPELTEIATWALHVLRSR